MLIEFNKNRCNCRKLKSAALDLCGTSHVTVPRRRRATEAERRVNPSQIIPPDLPRARMSHIMERNSSLSFSGYERCIKRFLSQKHEKCFKDADGVFEVSRAALIAVSASWSHKVVNPYQNTIIISECCHSAPAKRRLIGKNIETLWSFGGVNETFVWRQMCAAFRGSSSFYKSASLLSKGDAIFNAFPSRKEFPRLRWKCKTRVSASADAHKARIRRRGHYKSERTWKNKRNFSFETRALRKLVPLRTRIIQWHTRNFWGISHTSSTWMRTRFSALARLFWRNENSVAKRWVMVTHLLLPFTLRENSSPHALLWT